MSSVNDDPTLTFEQWMSYGIDQGWCGPPVCCTHDGLPMSPTERDEFDEGLDPCVHIIRMYESIDEKYAIEDSHSPSQWRNHYTN